MSVDSNEVAGVLEDAATLIEKVGWSRGNYRSQDSDGRTTGYCAVGAIMSAVGKNAEVVFVGNQSLVQQLAYSQISHWIRNNQRGYLGSASVVDWNDDVVDWNDDICSSKEEVIDGLMTVAKKIRNEGLSQ